MAHIKIACSSEAFHGLFKMMMSPLKMVVLSVCGTVYIVIVHMCSAEIFDHQDYLLQSLG